MTKILAYRAGDLDSPRGHFFADSYDAAWLYAYASGKPVVAYRVEVRDALRVPNQYAWVAERTGKTIEQVKADKSRSGDPYWLRKVDMRIMEEAVQAGFDAVIYEKPTTSCARWEVVVFSTQQCELLGECGPDGQIQRAPLHDEEFTPSFR
ncbi:hypothetical protein [Geopseudomonas aromaticivorans]